MDLGLSDDEFWSLTPRELEALRSRRMDMERIKNYRAGLQPSVYINSKRKKGAKAITPLEFFGQELPQRIAPADEIAQKLDIIKGIKDGQPR